MSWTATSGEPRIQNELIRIAVHFTDGQNAVDQDFVLVSAEDFNDFSRRIDQRMTELGDLFSAVGAFVPGEVVFKRADNPPPTPEEIDRQAFLTKVEAAKLAQKVAALPDDIRAEFKPEFADLLVGQ